MNSLTVFLQFSYNGFQEPIDVCVDREYGHYLVADNGVCAVLVFDSGGRFLFQVRLNQGGGFSLYKALNKKILSL